MNENLPEVFAALAKSSFRRHFHLRGKELEYLRNKGLPTVLEHAADFIEKRLAAASPVNDGKQTPMRHHPVFIAQHATATCCRGCLEKWHGIPKGVRWKSPKSNTFSKSSNNGCRARRHNVGVA
jgi:hypothetical protein